MGPESAFSQKMLSATLTAPRTPPPLPPAVLPAKAQFRIVVALLELWTAPPSPLAEFSLKTHCPRVSGPVPPRMAPPSSKMRPAVAVFPTNSQL